jgi:hypothetical protein
MVMMPSMMNNQDQEGRPPAVTLETAEASRPPMAPANALKPYIVAERFDISERR